MPTVRTSNLNGALPTAYDLSWQVYTDLNALQIAAFQAFPEDLTRYASHCRWIKEISGIVIPTSAPATIAGIKLLTDDRSQQKIAALKQALDNGTVVLPSITSTFPFLAANGIFQLKASDITTLYGYVVRYVQATYSVAATLLAGVNATPQTITARAQVDAAFAAIVVQ